MNGQLFEIGQAVALAKFIEQWGIINTGEKSVRIPDKSKIYHVAEYSMYFGEWYIQLNEIPPRDGKKDWYPQRIFAPVVSDSVLSKDLEEIFQEDLVESK